MVKIIVHPAAQGNLWIAKAPEPMELEGCGVTKVEAITQLRSQLQRQLRLSGGETQRTRSQTVKA